MADRRLFSGREATTFERERGGTLTAELDAMAVAVPVATAVAAEMARGGWVTLRGALARFFRRDGKPTVDRQLELLDTAEQTLSEAAEEHRDDLRNQLKQRLVLQLAAYLDRYPDMSEELGALLPAPDGPLPAGAPALTAQNNSNSQILQASGNLDAGSGGINYGVPPRNPSV
ncbi:hypothetical protein [Streptomyces montanisoli]|uniref:Uncharacterized protein n=1 Tax=Streptomyces montanisoli TaxID=2798581 RepID=A0A940M4J4_9ACTN|nr:hypothetical protein [Streptomyces montanisoli]MBP0455984.1 hypothetical protein [Streptomyces montanisoli]